MSITVSGRAVKRPAKMAMVNTNVAASALAVRAWRRAKAPAPWANLAYRPTECGLAVVDMMALRTMADEKLLADDPDLGPPLTEAEIAALPEEARDELRRLEAEALADDVAWILTQYRVTPDGDHLRFQGHAPGNFARVSVPVAGAETLLLRSVQACMPEAAFAGAAAAWAAAQKSGDQKAPNQKGGAR